MNTHAIICSLCELPIPALDSVHQLIDGEQIYCDECWEHRFEEIESLEGVEE